MATENKIKFVQEMVFSISSKKLQRVLERTGGVGDVRISFGISDEQKIYVSVSPDLDEVQAPDSSDASTEQTAMRSNLKPLSLQLGDSGDDEGRELGCPKPPGCKPPF
ncbi:MAG: hypothetical protein FGM46_10270 [Ferruginibacter sp.]|nr:hypothetical protein [Ferruginibacter sp.]